MSETYTITRDGVFIEDVTRSAACEWRKECLDSIRFYPASKGWCEVEQWDRVLEKDYAVLLGKFINGEITHTYRAKRNILGHLIIERKVEP